jgi:hypothetical protein
MDCAQPGAAANPTTQQIVDAGAKPLSNEQLACQRFTEIRLCMIAEPLSEDERQCQRFAETTPCAIADAASEPAVDASGQ